MEKEIESNEIENKKYLDDLIQREELEKRILYELIYYFSDNENFLLKINKLTYSLLKDEKFNPKNYE